MVTTATTSFKNTSFTAAKSAGASVLAFCRCSLSLHIVHAAKQMVCPLPAQLNVTTELSQLCAVL